MNRADTATKISSEVSGMFDAISKRYDIANDVLSFGVHHLWRAAMVKAVRPLTAERVLDLAAGTGVSSAALARSGARVTGVDFSEGMLKVAREKYSDNELLDFKQADATNLPFADNFFDAATISFGLRNVNDVQLALTEMLRVVKPGGRVVVCEFSTPASILRAPYRFYNRVILPKLAGVLVGSSEAYDYLAESIEVWPNQDELGMMMLQAGFERVVYRNLSAGIAALHRGIVPVDKNSGAAR